VSSDVSSAESGLFVAGSDAAAVPLRNRCGSSPGAIREEALFHMASYAHAGPLQCHRRAVPPPRQVAASNPAFASKVGYTLTYDVVINSGGPSASITSPSHNDVLTSRRRAAARPASSPARKVCFGFENPSIG